MSDRALYLCAAEDLRANERQWEAYQSTGHCVLLAGPGSGKTKTLTTKLARMLREDVEDPRGIACITYNTECARELETRLDSLGIAAGGRVFIGTVHSFSLTQILLPYGKSTGVGLPDDFTVATQQQACGAFERAVEAVLGGVNPNSWRVPFDRYRRSFLDRANPEWLSRDAALAEMIETYEADLRSLGLIDFDDMPLLAVSALAANPWLQRALVAKYPILAVDEYQDLGLALHGMVMGLCFSAGMRLFAVGDGDQSIYGFTGAFPQLLLRLADRADVETIRLGLNYRCGTNIVTASEWALGEERGYTSPPGAHQGTVYFHPCTGGYAGQANYLIETLIPEILARNPGTDLGQIAILYQAYFLGDEVAAAATAHGYAFIRTDNNALYPRGSRIMRWLEQCAMWCCGGWRTGNPKLSRVIGDGARLFHEVLEDDDQRLAFQREVTGALWERRDAKVSLHDWLSELREEILAARVAASRSLDDELATLNTFIARIDATGDIDDFTLGEFAGIGSGLARLNLSSLHSAKGREFDVVILFGAEEGRVPRNGANANEVREARRLLYVGFTRARHEIHLMYGQNVPSRFVIEVQQRMAAAEAE